MLLIGLYGGVSPTLTETERERNHADDEEKTTDNEG